MARVAASPCDEPRAFVDLSDVDTERVGGVAATAVRAIGRSNRASRDTLGQRRATMAETGSHELIRSTARTERGARLRRPTLLRVPR